MMGVNSRRPKAVIVSKTAVDHAGVFLQSLPEKPKENLSLREAVDKLRDQIREALNRGYSYENLAVMLTDKGIEISASTLKNYVPSGKRQAAKQKALLEQSALDQTEPVKRKGGRPKKNKSAALESESIETIVKKSSLEADLQEQSIAVSPPEAGVETTDTEADDMSTASIDIEAQAEAELEATPTPKKRGRTPGVKNKTGAKAEALKPKSTGVRQPRSAAAGRSSGAKSTRSSSTRGQRKRSETPD